MHFSIQSARTQLSKFAKSSFTCLLLLSIALAQTPQPSPKVKEDADAIKSADKLPDDKRTDDQSKKKKEKRGSLVIAPIPISSPAFGSGLVLVMGYVFQFDRDDKISPPSTIGLAGVRTNNGTRAWAIGSRLYLKENTYQTTLAIAAGNANFDFYGIGRRPGKSTVFVPLSIDGKVFLGEFMRNIGKSIFIGPKYQYRRLGVGLNGAPVLGGFEIPPIDIQANSAALGLHVQRDTRNSTFYPSKGSLIDFNGDFFDQVWGSRREYQTYKVAFNNYRAINSKTVFAYRAMGCSANGSVPFYDLCMYGFNSDLRGYTTGEFQNRRMFATQAEVRRDLWRRFGVVGFAGFGGVGRKWSEFRMDELLPAGGVGLRFTLDKKNHINYRIDYAIGRAGPTLSIGVSEAF